MPIEKSNYIICKYNTKGVYENGFLNEYRHNISYIKIGNSEFNPDENFIIEENTSIEIYFSETITSLRSFFTGIENIDKNAQKIISVDLSHFDSSLLENIESMFFYCYSLEEVNFENFDTSKVTRMV